MPIARLASGVVWLGFFAFVLPLLAAGCEMIRATTAIHSALNVALDGTERAASGGDASSYGVNGKLSAAEVAKSTAALKSITAPKNAIAGSARRVTVAGLLFEQRKLDLLETVSISAGEKGPPAKALNSAVTKPLPVSIEFASAKREALILMTDDFISLEISSDTPANARAALGIESANFPEVSQLPPGVLAGFKISASGTAEANSPGDLSDRNWHGRRGLCQALRSWAQHFGLRFEDVEFVLFQDPTSVRFTGIEWVSDSKTVVRLDSTDFATTCD
jgi:hypothetical protein